MEIRILIVGAGALGGYYGAALAKGGADVSFLVRSQRAAQLAERGLAIKSSSGTFATPVKTVLAGDLEGPYDVVFLACKAYDLTSALGDFAAALAPDGAVLPVLNGINHIDVLKDRLGAGRVLGGVTLFSAARTPEGEIAVPGHGSGRTIFGELSGERSTRCEAIRTALAAGGVAAEISDNIVAEMWAKFCVIGAIAAVATLTHACAGEVAAAPAGAGFVAAAFEECARITTAEGYPPAREMREFVTRLYGQAGSNYTPSMLADIENSRPTEGEHIIGDLVRRAERFNIKVAILRAALCNLQIYESRRAAA